MMFDLNEYPIFAGHKTAIQETSLDSRDGQAVYMTQSQREAVNFDEVKTEYVSGLGLSEVPRSSDALMESGKGELIFVEFKNGFMDRAKQFAVRKKIYDSILMFTDITSTRISDLRRSATFILVYNEAANQGNTLDEALARKREAAVQPSAAFDSFAKAIGRYAGEEYICFGLKIFQKYCFKEVHTFTETEFDAYIAGI